MPSIFCYRLAFIWPISSLILFNLGIQFNLLTHLLFFSLLESSDFFKLQLFPARNFSSLFLPRLAGISSRLNAPLWHAQFMAITLICTSSPDTRLKYKPSNEVIMKKSSENKKHQLKRRFSTLFKQQAVRRADKDGVAQVAKDLQVYYTWLDLQTGVTAWRIKARNKKKSSSCGPKMRD